MGKGGSSSSSNTTNTKNTSGQNAIQGDNLGVALSGVSDSEINVSMSDHGAIEAAKEMSELALNSTKDVATNAMDNNAEVSKTALDMGENIAQGALDLSRETSEVMANAHSENLQYVAGLAGSQAKQNSDNLKAMTSLAKTNSNGGSTSANSAVTKVVGLVVAGTVIVAVAKAVSA